MNDKKVSFVMNNCEKYLPVIADDDDDTSHLLNAESEASSRPLHTLRSSRASMLALLTIFFASCVISSLCGLIVGRRYPSDSGAIHHVSKWSPVVDGVPMSFHIEQFNGTFVHENIYRQDASPEVDAAWDGLGVRFRNIIVPAKDAHRVGFRPQDHMQLNSKYGGGYPAFIEGFHQLHCLNLLRQGLWYNYDYYHSQGDLAWGDPEDVQRWHVSHCLDFLRQHLMCTIDIGVFASVWVNKTEPKPFVDFNTRHTCRDFNAVRKWAREHQAPENPPADWILPPTPGDGVRVLDLAP
ncbi:uncharacterized protein AB675_10170 [Cyphellophora attinorum]|uniref:Tat pathway signal sequence n=1 Tax=Cyphellophora attinorum TaxID=1664694 RepID=A0A0N0NIA5_9EURO|nr:uncharacterized protein AB675_10170 [Phialophora attinorum]KPI35209.1 hypothetical protein AB675_10170 [Phialophora attinorum]